jgi:hypothetical protein
VFGNVTLQFSEEIIVIDPKLINNSIELFIKPAPLTIEVMEKMNATATFIDILGKKVI